MAAQLDRYTYLIFGYSQILGELFVWLTSCMADYDIRFFEYLAQAQSEALLDRESRILELRYGLTGENAATLAAIGKVFGVSRERIRQILGKTHRKICSKGQRQLKANNVNDPCAELLIYVRSIIRPQETDSVERLVEFCRNNLSSMPQQTHASPLVTYLTYPDKPSRQKILEEAKKVFQDLEN
jgi:Sigma-70, region 4